MRKFHRKIAFLHFNWFLRLPRVKFPLSDGYPSARTIQSAKLVSRNIAAQLKPLSLKASPTEPGSERNAQLKIELSKQILSFKFKDQVEQASCVAMKTLKRKFAKEIIVISDSDEDAV